MRVWAVVGFEGYWPSGTAAVVVEATKRKAVAMLNHALALRGLPQSVTPQMVEEITTDAPRVRILLDGNY